MANAAKKRSGPGRKGYGAKKKAEILAAAKKVNLSPTLLLALVLLAAAAPAARAADEIHWTIAGPTSITFNWRGWSGQLRYGPTSSYGTTVSGHTPSPLPLSSPGPFWEAPLTGLVRGAIYHYSIEGGPDHLFRTPPAAGPASFVVYAEGDIGDTVTYSRVGPVQSLIAAGRPAFVLMLGDLTYGNTNGQALVDVHFNNVMKWSQDAAYMPAWGNHEWGTSGDDMRNYKGRFGLPNPQASPGAPGLGCCGEDWSWFDYGGVRFIAYPEPFSGAWADWNTRAKTLMDGAQANSAIHAIVTFGHRPAYSSGHHPGSSTLAGYLDALGDAHSKYVLNLCGHSHNYERSYPQHGVTHVTVGTGGSTLEQETGACPWRGGCPPPAWSAYRAMHHGALRLVFTPTSVRGQMVCGPAGDSGSNQNDVTCSLGDVIDTFEIGGGQPPVVSAPSFDVPVSPSGAALAIDRVSPNPAAGELGIAYRLADATPARLELVDGRGRILVHVDLGALGPGPHFVRLDRTLGVSPGAYWLRLRQGRASTTARVTFVR